MVFQYFKRPLAVAAIERDEKIRASEAGEGDEVIVLWVPSDGRRVWIVDVQFGDPEKGRDEA